MDTQFLGGDILDEEHQLRPGQGGVDPAVFNLADAVILGNIGDDTSSFETSDSGFHLMNDLGAARLYVSGRSQAVMSPDAVIATINNSENVRLTPFEKHVLRFIDGKRPVEAIRRQAGLDEAEVKTALANLADKGVVKVVGRALADADFDSETAPGNAPKSKSRRMRGTLVGAVVVVGDAADQAIDDAFRTQVRSERPDVKDLHPPADDDGVFSGSDLNLPNADSADVNSFDVAGTDEIQPRRPAITSSTSTVRPAVLREAINAGGRTSVRGTVPVLSDVDASDGFDDFGDASDVATAMVQQPSLSEESSLPGVEPTGLRPEGARAAGVFADPARGRGLSDLEDFDEPGFGDLADSRVEPRPVLPPLPSVTGAVATGRPAPGRPRAAPAPIPSLSEASKPEYPAESGSLNDDERAAFSGGVWGGLDEVDADGGATNIKEPMLPSSLRSELSTSLSALLGSDEESVPPTTPARFADGPRRPAAAAPAPMAQVGAAKKAGFDSDEEPTGLREPPPAVARPTPALVRPTPAPAPAPAPRPRPTPSPAAAPPPSPSSLDASGLGDAGWERSTPQARPSGMMERAARPPQQASPAMAEGRGAASDLYPDDEDDDFVAATSQVKPLQTSLLDPPPAAKPPLDLTMPPSEDDGSESEDDADESDSAWSTSNSPAANRGRPQPPPPEPSRFDSRAQESMSRAAAPSSPVPTEFLSPGVSSSAEVLDSAMVIRPAIKAVPLALAAKKVRVVAAPQPPPPEDDADDFMVDPDATLNLPAQPKSKEGEERRKRKKGAPSADGAPQPMMAEPLDKETNNGSRRAPTEDMRRKARNLMEQAQQDHAVGRVGAARMNAKLATIYDPDNETYRRILADWERPSGTAGGDASRPEYVMLYEQAQEREDDDDVDGALVLLEKGLRLAPNPAAFHNRIGVLLAMRKRDFERAKDEIQKAIALEPKNPHYSNNLGKVMAKANRRRGDAVANAR
jgi:hypothetical protein